MRPLADPPSVRRRSLVVVGLLLGLATLAVPSVAGHADLESSIPAAGSTVAEAPLTLELTFTEEVAAGGVTARVVGPDGGEAQAGTAEVDLNDPERRRVTLSLRGNLPPGVYTVEWETTSSLDEHGETGSFAFAVAGADATPAASPPTATTPTAEDGLGATPGAVAGSVEVAPTLPPEARGNPLSAEEGRYDTRAFGLSIGAGILAAGAIFLVWRAVRPHNPVFGGRARG